ncbi:PAS domain-containing protein [Ferrimonas senticii]|uniref:PAS domain-containing protein n=1 Tax=Ferrimonas senticii TaxID=394566 RepID=UPI0003F8461A|nr:PAS domain-containing protein [Ferrimonas senticii]
MAWIANIKHQANHRFTLWCCLVLAIACASLLAAHRYGKRNIIEQQSLELSQQWHQQLAAASASSNQQLLQQLATLLHSKFTDQFVIFDDQDLQRPLHQLSYSRLPPIEQQRLLEQANQQRKQQQPIVITRQQMLFYSSRVPLPELINNRHAAAIVVTAFDFNRIAPLLRQHFDWLLLVSAAILLSTIVLLFSFSRSFFIRPLKKLIAPAHPNRQPLKLELNLVDQLAQQLNELKQQRQQAEQQLSQQGERQKRLQQRLSMTIQLGALLPWRFDFNNYELQLSDEALTVLGLEKLSKTIGINELKLMLHPSDLNQVQLKTERLQPQQICHFTIRLLSPNNHIYHLRCVACRIDSDHQRSLIGYSVDDTQAVRLQQAVNGSQAQYQQLDTLLQAILKLEPFATVQCDQQGTIINANQQLLSLLGQPSKTLIGNNLQMLLEPNDRRHHWPSRQFLLQLAAQEQGSLIVFDSQQQPIPCQVLISQQRIDGRQFYTLVLRPPSASLNRPAPGAVTTTNPDQLYLLLDEQRQIYALSTELAQRLGYQRQQLLHRSVLQLLPTAIRAGCDRWLIGQQPVTALTLPVRHNDGRWLRCQLQLQTFQHPLHQKTLLLIQVNRLCWHTTPSLQQQAC